MVKSRAAVSSRGTFEKDEWLTGLRGLQCLAKEVFIAPAGQRLLLESNQFVGDFRIWH
jgi:hypothetical protein